MLMTETLERPLAESLDDRARYWIGEIAEKLQEGDTAVFEYDPQSRIEEIEYEPRDGFWPWTSGGYEICLPASLAHCWSGGYAPAPVAGIIASGNSIIADCWAEQYPERPGLVDCICADEGSPAAQWQDEAQDFELEGWLSDDDCYYWKARAILTRIDGSTPTGEPAPPIAGIADKVAHGLWQAKAAKEIEARKAPKKFAPILEGVEWAARSVACSTFTDNTDRAAFMAKCGYQGEF